MEAKHILMVDDVNTNLKCAAEVLKDKFRISMVKSGIQALRFLAKEVPDLILLDISMPDMDGYETLERIQSNPLWKDIPVIFLTADTDGESESKGLKMGAMDYIRKPFEPDVMLSRVEKVLEMADSRKDLELCARKDVLTGLWNRRYLEEKIAQCIEKENPRGVFMLLDMDNFKRVNDDYGHLVGDAVLIQFAKTMQEYEEDKCVLCRIGGDEFALFIEDMTDASEIRRLAERINSQVVNTVNKNSESDISVSIGIAVMPENGQDLKTLYHKADKALYFVKENGKRGYHFYQEKDKQFQEEEQLLKSSVAIDLLQLRSLFEEKTTIKGAFEVEYDGFRKIYQLVSRSVKRSKRNVQIVLFTMSERENVLQEIGGLETAMSDLNTAIVTSLRKGDVATQYSSTQHIVILMDSTTENGKKVAERVKSVWLNNSEVGKNCFKLDYDIEQFETNEEKEG